LRAVNTVRLRIFVNFPHTYYTQNGSTKPREDQASLLDYYAKVLATETAYVPAKEEQDEDEDEDGPRSLAVDRVSPSNLQPHR